MSILDTLQINDTFTNELPADPIIANTQRQVSHACYSYVMPTLTAAPELVHVADEVAALLGISRVAWQSEDFVKLVTGNAILKNSHPYAMCYGGHQFGHWAGQLGDGRAINLAEVEHNDQRWALQLKGAGLTPYSRTADGLAVLRSSIREYLCSEAMHHLGVPTTRALSLALSGDLVLRDMLYNGNAAYEKGAIVCRVAPSFIRFGNFEILAARKDKETLESLVNYTIKHFYTHLGTPSKDTYVGFFKEVVDRTLEMVLHWQRVGFVHGVMNTDNLSILGLTIDYGPYGWLEGYDPEWTPNTTDRQHRRYRFGNQPNIAFWNLVQLANALLVLIEDPAPLETVLGQAQKDFGKAYFSMIRQKIGLEKQLEEDRVLISSLLDLLTLSETDMTIFFRSLANFNAVALDNQSIDPAYLDTIKAAFYNYETIDSTVVDKWISWLRQYANRLQLETLSYAERKEKMNLVNPKYVLRNYMAQIAIDAADKGDYSIIEELLTVLRQPYAEQTAYEKWFAKRPEWARNKVGCSMLSCSS